MKRKPNIWSVPHYEAIHYDTLERCDVISICFNNNIVEVLPESELEGGSTVGWEFKDILLRKKVNIFDKEYKPIYEGDILDDGNLLYIADFGGDVVIAFAKRSPSGVLPLGTVSYHSKHELVNISVIGTLLDKRFFQLLPEQYRIYNAST